MSGLTRNKARQWAKRLLLRVGAPVTEANIMTLSVALAEATRGEYPTFEPTQEDKIAAMLTAELAKEPGLVTPTYLFDQTREHVPREQWDLLKTACKQAVVAHNQKVK